MDAQLNDLLKQYTPTTDENETPTLDEQLDAAFQASRTHRSIPTDLRGL